MPGDLNHYFYKDLVHKSRLIFPVGTEDTDEAVVVDVTRRGHVPRVVGITRVRRNYKNKYPDSLYVTIWILCGAGIET